MNRAVIMESVQRTQEADRHLDRLRERRRWLKQLDLRDTPDLPQEEAPCTLTPRLRDYVLDRDRLCQVCGALEDLTVDHRRPISRGGWHHLENLWTLCRRCNAQKGNRTVAEYVGQRLEELARSYRYWHRYRRGREG